MPFLSRRSRNNAPVAARLGVLVCMSLLGVSAVSGCGDDAQPESVDVPGTPAPEPTPPMEIASDSGCAIDADCAAGRFCFLGRCGFECDGRTSCADGQTCSERGRCTDGSAQAEAGTAGGQVEAGSADDPLRLQSDLHVVNTPQTVYRLGKDQDEISLSLELDNPAPQAGLRYRVARGYTAEDDGGRGLVQRTAGGDTHVDIPIAAGVALAGPDQQKIAHIKVFSEVGNFTVAIVPHYAVSGSYTGTATLQTFGRTGLPIEFQVVTQPNDASLEEAEHAWLVLPVGRQFLFSPLAATDGGPDYVARELVYDDFVEQWVAKFGFGFELADDGVVSAPERQVRREMRLQIEPTGGGQLVGQISDTWTGLYDQRSTSGVRNVAAVQFTGDLSVSRYTAASSYEDISVEEYADADPQLHQAPPIDQCDEQMFDVDPVEVDATAYDCDAIATAAEFDAADAGAQAACATAVAHRALDGQSTSQQIRAYLGGGTNDSGQSFAEFMQDCTAGADGICKPTDDILCARQLTARAYRAQQASGAASSTLVDAYGEVTREAFLGQELGAFGTDSDLRLEWLKTTDYPAVIVSEVKALNEQLLDEWKAKVLDVHLGVLRGQFDPSGLAVLSQQSEGADAADSRETLLTYMTQSWRGSMDSLTLAATRWNKLLQGDQERADKADLVSRRLFDLYVAAGMLRNLNLAAGTGYLSARLADGFAQLQRELGKLSLPFDSLIYARDAEVVVNTSVDPLSGNDTLLGEREDAALAEVERAAESVTSVIDQAQAEALNTTQLINRMDNQINDQRSTLVEMCGLPVGCTTNDIRTDPSCHVRVDAGKCGFLLNKETDAIEGFGTGDQSVSEAGRALLDVAEAARNIGIAESDLQELVDRTDLQKDELDTFADVIRDRNDLRLQGVRELKQNIADRQSIRDAAVNQVLDDIDQRISTREASIESSRETFEKWDKIRRDGVAVEMGLLISANAAHAAADGLRDTAESTKDFTEAAVAGFPKSEVDLTAPARMAVKIGSAASVLGMRTAATAFDTAGTALETARESYQLTSEAEMAALQDASDLSAAITDQQLADLKDDIKKTETKSQAAIAKLQEIVEAAQAARNAQLSYSEDLDTFRQRRLDLRQKLTGIAGLDLRVQQAKLQYKQAVAVYLGIVQRAKLQNAKLQDLLRQSEHVDQLVGSPAVIFGRANRLDQAEVRLNRAKDKLMDWLVALEYYAVRPFMDQRLSILLARNTYQLQKIAQDLERLQRNCGGPTNKVHSDLSLRDDLLGLSESSVDPVSGRELSPSMRLREVLSRGYVPVDKRVRYSTDDTIGTLMSRDPDILAATFFIDLSDFANLELTCNAKIATLGVELVGELGDARPTVSILYDGTSMLRSCQPGIDDYVAQFGPGTTNYGKITHLRTVGRSMSPVAGVNEFGDDDDTSQTLGGLPLASQYTILINKSAGENSQIDWNQLKDIELRLTYDYQDIFPAGQCE